MQTTFFHRGLIGKKRNHDLVSVSDCFSLGDILGATELQGPTSFYYQDLKVATNNFCEESKLGEGGFGDVFKVLQSSTVESSVQIFIQDATINRTRTSDHQY